LQRKCFGAWPKKQMAKQCSSFDFCGNFVEQDAPSWERWCPSCREHLENVKQTMRGRRITKAKAKPAAPATDKGHFYRNCILEKLAEGELTSTELARECGTSTATKTFARSRDALIVEGRITHSPCAG